ncbi:MAG: hypothetical protein R2794_10255 [Chitinophagales bacterium]
MGVIPPFPADLYPAFADVDGTASRIFYTQMETISKPAHKRRNYFAADVTDTTATAAAQRVYDVFGYGAVEQTMQKIRI